MPRQTQRGNPRQTEQSILSDQLRNKFPRLSPTQQGVFGEAIKREFITPKNLGALVSKLKEQCPDDGFARILVSELAEGQSRGNPQHVAMVAEKGIQSLPVFQKMVERPETLPMGLLNLQQKYNFSDPALSRLKTILLTQIQQRRTGRGR
ncbi:MAG: hypothetical protein V1777_01600 [Candidatus Micrarchaeota archaeon]